MSQHNQSPQPTTRGLDLFFILIGLLLAWPAMFVSFLIHWSLKRHPSWQASTRISAAILGALGALVLTRTTPVPIALTAFHALESLIVHRENSMLLLFLQDALPVWERTLLVFPWGILLLDLVLPKSLQATLMEEERQRRRRQVQRSRHAARKALKAPQQINGKGVLGAVIDNPNQ